MILIIQQRTLLKLKGRITKKQQRTKKKQKNFTKEIKHVKNIMRQVSVVYNSLMRNEQRNHDGNLFN